MTKGTLSDGVVYHAGFPNAGEDRVGLPVGLDSLIIKHRASTFMWKLDYAGVPELGWKAGSIVVVDRALEPRHGDAVVVVAEEDFAVRLYQRTPRVRLMTPRGEEDQSENIALWGVITYVIQAVR